MIDELIRQGRTLYDAGDEQAVVDYFVALAAQYPDDAVVLFETGGAYDSAGHETEAADYYRRALALGLPDELRPRIAVQFGSTLRNLGQYDEAVRVLREAAGRFPADNAVKAFLALALFSAGQPAEALALMLHTTVDTPGFYDRYHRSLRQYADMLTA